MRDTPHLVNTSTVIQFGDWSRAGFEYMAKKYFSSKIVIDELPVPLLQDDGDTTTIDLIQNSNDEDKEEDDDMPVEHLEKVVLCMIDMHQDCELTALGYLQDAGHYIYVSPQLFENFLRTYKRLIK